MASTLPTSQHSRGPATDPSPDRIGLVVADAGWFTTENLFREAPASRASTLLLHCADYANAWRRGRRPWSWNGPPVATGPGQWRLDLALPTGWMKQFPRWGMRPIARAVRRWRAAHAAGSPMALVITYPYYLHLHERLRPDRLVYFNVDDYSLYWPRVADQVGRLEIEAVRRSDLTICVSRLRAEELRQKIPDAAERIRHLPHGAPSASLPDQPQHLPAPAPADIAHLPRPLVGYVGTLEDRVDWALLARVAEANPRASLVLVGRVGPDDGEAWQALRRRCLAMSNVHAIGWRSQATIDAYNRAFDVALIPYRVDHPFNVSCSPTKIMDYMAAGRPVVSTDLPECRLHSDRFDVVAPGAFAEAVSDRLAAGSDDGRAAARLAWARDHSCRSEVERLLDWLS